jgi:hypothetical protein
LILCNDWLHWCFIKYNNGLTDVLSNVTYTSMYSLMFHSIYHHIPIDNWLHWCFIPYINGFTNVSSNVTYTSMDSLMFHLISSHPFHWCFIQCHLYINGFPDVLFNISSHPYWQMASLMFHSIYQWIHWCFIQCHLYINGFPDVSFNISSHPYWHLASLMFHSIYDRIRPELEWETFVKSVVKLLR